MAKTSKLLTDWYLSLNARWRHDIFLENSTRRRKFRKLINLIIYFIYYSYYLGTALSITFKVCLSDSNTLPLRGSSTFASLHDSKYIKFHLINDQ